MECWAVKSIAELSKFVEALEQPLKSAAKVKHEATCQRNYAAWKARIEALAAHIVADCAKDGVTVTTEVKTLEESSNEDGTLSSGSIANKPFTGLPSFNKKIKPYYPNFDSKLVGKSGHESEGQ